jgi:hypothetical protein
VPLSTHGSRWKELLWNTFLALLTEQLKEEDNVLVWGHYASDCLTVITTWAQAYELVVKHGQSAVERALAQKEGAGALHEVAKEFLGAVAETATGAGVVVELFVSAYEGYNILRFPEKGEVGAAMEEDNTPVAYLEELKGIVLLGGSAGAVPAMAASGYMAVESIAAAVFATGGLIVAGAAIAVVGIEVAIYFFSEHSTMDRLAIAVRKAAKLELPAMLDPNADPNEVGASRTSKELTQLVGDVKRVAELVKKSYGLTG